MIKLPYGNTGLEMEEKGASVLTSRVDQLKSSKSGAELVKEALDNPTDSKKLCELARGKNNAVIIISDHTRPVPSRDIIPLMLKELRLYNPDIDVTLLVATGFHRGTTKAELISKLGEDIVSSEKIVIHDCDDAKSNVNIGVLPSGAPLVIDKVAANTELLVSEGFIEPHFFAGFSGGRKSVLPGVCDRVTVLGNHCSEFIDSAYARTGILDGNPIHKDMLAAGRMAKLGFIVNVVIDEDKKTVAAFAGDFETAHREGCDFLKSYCSVKAAKADIVVSTNAGAPLDQNVYQAVKGMTAAEATANKGAVIIMCAECADGTGGDGFYRALRDCESPRELYDRTMTVPADKTIPDQWEAQVLARILMNHTVIFVTREELKSVIEDMKMTYAKDLDSALATARKIKGDGASLTIIPNGISVIVEG